MQPLQKGEAEEEEEELPPPPKPLKRTRKKVVNETTETKDLLTDLGSVYLNWYRIIKRSDSRETTTVIIDYVI